MDADPTVARAEASVRTSLSVTLVAAAHFANDAVTSMFPALLPTLSTRFGLEPTEPVLLASLFAISTSLPQPLFGLLADRLGGRRVGAVGLLVSGALIAGLAYISSETALWMALLLGGLGSAALHPSGIGLARSASRNPGLAIAVFSASGMAGGALGPLLALGITASLGFERLAWAAVPLLLTATLLFRFAPAVSRKAEAASPVAPPRLFRGRTLRLVFVALLSNVVMLTFSCSLPMLLVAERGLGETSPVIGVTLAVFSLAIGVGGILGGALTRWLSFEWLVVGSIAVSAGAFEGVLLTNPGSPAYLLALALAGGLLGIHTPLLMARAQELSPGAESTVAGVLLGATSAAAGVVYTGLGVLQSRFGIAQTMAGVALLVLPAAYLALTTLKPAVSSSLSGLVDHEACACGRCSVFGSTTS